MNRDVFDSLKADGHNRIPVYRSVLADLDTPLSVYLKLADGPDAYLLESVEGGEKWGRFSIIGLPCARRYVLRGDTVTAYEDGGDVVIVEGWALARRVVLEFPGLRAVTPEGDLTSCYEVTSVDDPRTAEFFIGRWDGDRRAWAVAVAPLAGIGQPVDELIGFPAQGADTVRPRQGGDVQQDAGPPPISMAEGAQSMADLLRRLPDTDAVICVSDLSAFGALFGFVGMLVAVPVAAALGVLARFGVDQYLGSRLFRGLSNRDDEDS